MIDLHCHILPGLDDGPKSVDLAIEMAGIAQSDGIRKIVATPHLFKGAFGCEDLGVIEQKRAELEGRLIEKGVSVEILAGAEVHLSHNLIPEIKEHRHYLVLNGSSYMFLEFPSDHVFSGVRDLFFELMTEGVVPIVAHPERNTVFQQSPRLLYELVQMGALAQANSGSLLGDFGSRAQSSVFDLLASNLIHFISSDAHNTHSKAPRLSAARDKAAAVLGETRANALVEDNPRAVLEDREVPFFPEPIDPGAREKTLKVKFPSFFKFKR